MKKIWTGLMYGLIFFLIALCLSGNTWTSINYLSRQVAGWTSTTGTVSKTFVVMKTRGRGTKYSAWRVEYSYATPRGTFSSHRYAFGGDFEGDFGFDPHLKPGSQLQVFYCPNNPADAVLDKTPPWRDTDGSIIITLTSLVVSLLLGAIVAWADPGKAETQKAENQIAP
jgi:Protein of unknown function (DUF3592)